ncbi:sigma 54-interacting transcriptional regulator [Paraliomyxa miuraensis]|uniref:sigma 54-interacting transcriptional regulator n=1 Tax=Paraliomyxa miuraensis TaxID=376150 RepID=UPI0022528DB9|nr:sigma 54-interacting transcriptional regulator [Paraliomyxa miuraensis]MCX4242015.1 sigma 54-interacting transcriptional regulator [Paraliomyxa miuraensis]
MIGEPDRPGVAHGDRTESVLHDEEPTATSTWARLCVVSPREVAAIHPLPRGTTLGREPGSKGLRVPHKTVSRRHLELRAEGRHDTFVVADLGSRNGSWINAVPVGSVPRVLRSGDVLRLGEVVAVFEQGSGVLEERGGVSTAAVVGRSAGAIALRNGIARAAADASPVLIIGESGTGKESVAHELHRLSGRAGPLVIANCATLTSSLADSQLFGHERGAFTGAVRAQPGLFRSASGGSLFLDEIGELPLELQPKLLRAVERGEVVPLGDTRTITVDTRIIAATHRDLVAAVEEGGFRRDLYARLSLARIHVPRLAERRADLLVWIDVLHQRWQADRGVGAPPFEFSGEAVEVLLLHDWPENLRGLDHLVRELATDAASGSPPARISRARLAAWARPCVPSSATVSTPLPPPVEPEPTPTPAREARPPKPTREELLAVLEDEQWNLRAVARHYARDRRQIYRWVEAYGIELRR